MTSTTAAASSAGGQAAHVWEETSGSQLWENAVREDEEGNIIVDAGDTMAQAVRKRRKRQTLQDYAQRNRRVVRDMIRYMYILVDSSKWMRSKDPTLPGGTRMDVTIQIVKQFIEEFYDQNPLSHLGLIVVYNGEAEVLTPLSSGKPVHQRALSSLQRFVASQPPSSGGEFSLQNGLEVAGRSLGHQPGHGSREVVILTAALSTCDPGHVLTETLPQLTQSNIRVSCFALQAELHVCRKITELSHGAMGVCLDKTHFRDWLLNQCVPPPSHRGSQADDIDEDTESNRFACEMIPMGFPTRTVSEIPTIVHASSERTILTRTAYSCPQCQAKNSEIPTECAVCRLKLVLAPHLARSFHHLFPVAPFREKPFTLTPSDLPGAEPSPKVQPPRLDNALLIKSADNDQFCFACLRPFVEDEENEPTKGDDTRKPNKTKKAEHVAKPAKQQVRLRVFASPHVLHFSHFCHQDWLRFECPHCLSLFCVDCDAFLHESLHNCPGCLSA
jgi:transcription initiation factor TFIIH subunit 2